MNNMMSDQIKLYANIEALLRKAEADSEPLMMREIVHHETLEPFAKSDWQLRDIVKSMVSSGFVISEGTGPGTKYYWNVERTDHPEVKPYRVRRQARPFKNPNMEPGDVVVARPDVQPEPQARFDSEPKRIVEQATLVKDVELVIAGVTIVIGKNPATGRPRIVIES